MAHTVKCLSTMRETRVRSLGQEDPLEKEMAVHSSTLAGKIPWTQEPGRLQSVGLQRVGHDWATSLSLSGLISTSVYEGEMTYIDPHFYPYVNNLIIVKRWFQQPQNKYSYSKHFLNPSSSIFGIFIFEGTWKRINTSCVMYPGISD